MIAVFPTVYPDELLYSQLARFYARSGYPGYTFAAEDLFENKTVRPDIEFLNAYTPEALRLITHEKPIEEIVLKHTMFPYYARFIGYERRMKAFQSLVAMDMAYHNLLPLPKSKEKVIRHLRYCPICAEHDRETYGETYWHRIHQMHGIRICPTHHCYLIETDIRMDSRVSPSLVTAEEMATSQSVITMSDDPIECALAGYIAEVFQSDFDLESTVEVGQYLHSRMEGTKYLSRRGQQRNIALLHNDFIAHYGSLADGFNELWQLQKLLSGSRHSMTEVCMTAMFLGVPADDLAHMELPQIPQYDRFDATVKKLHDDGMNYQEIAQELGAAYDTVKAIGLGTYGTYHYDSPVRKERKSKRYDWTAIDNDLLPKVHDIVRSINADKTKRPCRITIGTVERMLNLPKNGLRNCSKCRSEIQRYYETQEQFWAREIAWAVKTILDSGQQLSRTRVKNMTEIRDAKISACLPYLGCYADDALVSEILKLYENQSGA